MQLRIVDGEALQVVQRGASPAVDRLVVVADRGQAVPIPDQCAQQLVLDRVRVLIFVDEEVPEPLPPSRQAVGVRLQHLQRQADQVVEVDCLVTLQRRLIVDECARDPQIGFAPGRLDGRCRFQQRILPERDPCGGCFDQLAVRGGQQLGQQIGAVIRIEDRERGLQPDRLAARAQDPHPEGMEGADRRAVCGGETDGGAESLRHLGGRLVGEGDRGDRPGCETAVDQVRELRGDDPGLSRTGAGNHQAGTVEMADRIGLRRIQVHPVRSRPDRSPAASGRSRGSPRRSDPVSAAISTATREAACGLSIPPAAGPGTGSSTAPEASGPDRKQ